MIELGLALSAFLITHLLPAWPGLRAALIARLGKRLYLSLYGLVSLATLIWVIAAALRAPVIILWWPAGWQAWITLILSPLALFLIVAGLLSANPLSLTLFPSADRPAGAILRVTRHPIFWGALIWALSHIPPNGDLRSFALFTILAALAASGFWLGDRRSKRRLGEEWDTLAAGTSILPFAATLAGRNLLGIDKPMLVALAVSALLTAWLLMGGHAALFGVDPVAATGY